MSAAARNSRPLTIRLQLACLTAACVLPVWLCGGYLLFYSYQGRLALIERHMQETARALTLVYDRELARMQASLRALATSPSLAAGNFAAFHRQANEILHDYPEGDILLADKNGQQLVNSYVPVGAPLPARSIPGAVRRVFETGNPGISDLYTGAVTGRRLVGVDVPVLLDGRVVYDLAMTVPVSRMATILSMQQLPSEWLGTILDGNGVVIARSRDAEQFIGQRLDLGPRPPSQAEGKVEMLNLEGEPAFASFSRSTMSGWTVLITVPKAYMRAELARWLAWTIAGISVLSAAGLGLAMHLARRIAGSIQALVPPAMALGRGEPVSISSMTLHETNAVAMALVGASRLLQQRTKEREQAEELQRKAEAQATIDGLTGVYNRARFNELLRLEIERASRYGLPLSLVMYDIDRFKQINDTHGHQAGDDVLVGLTALIARQVRQSDILARWGGDEFMVILPMLPFADAAEAAERWRRIVSASQFPPVGNVTCSFGIASLAPGDTADDLARRADQALYDAKHHGRDRVSGTSYEPAAAKAKAKANDRGE